LFTPSGSALTNGHESIDGTVSFEAHNGVNRPKTVQEAKGHGLKAWPYTSDFNGASNQDGIIYYPTQAAAEYPSCSSNSANTPWGWDDGDDGDSDRGEFALDPARLFDYYFDGIGNFSQQYINNRCPAM
jgi:hypothetical protein